MQLKADNKEYIKVNFIFPKATLDELTKIAGTRKRSPFVVNLVKEELERRKLIKILEDSHGIWKKEDYPELATEEKIDKFVQSLRKESEQRVKKNK